MQMNKQCCNETQDRLNSLENKLKSAITSEDYHLLVKDTMIGIVHTKEKQFPNRNVQTPRHVASNFMKQNIADCLWSNSWVMKFWW